MDTPFGIGSVLRIARVLHGLAQGEVARRAGITRSTLSEIERGWRVPRHEQVKRILAAINQDSEHPGWEAPPE
jgi:transcriptional regulator with XRE-family HTH domain